MKYSIFYCEQNIQKNVCHTLLCRYWKMSIIETLFSFSPSIYLHSHSLCLSHSPSHSLFSLTFSFSLSLSLFLCPNLPSLFSFSSFISFLFIVFCPSLSLSEFWKFVLPIWGSSTQKNLSFILSYYLMVYTNKRMVNILIIYDPLLICFCFLPLKIQTNWFVWDWNWLFYLILIQHI